MRSFPSRMLNVVLIASSLLSTRAFAQTHLQSREYHGQAVWQLPEIGEEEVNIGLWALIIAKEFDNSVDIPKYLNRLDSSVAEIRLMLAGRVRDTDLYAATRMFLYEAGPWNKGRPYSYDLDDPLGTHLENQLLSIYLATRKGNCVSMPTLFLALLERIDPTINVHGVVAPLHLFCRLHDRQTGDVWNIETTNGAHPARNQWYIEELNIQQRGVDSGSYLRDLTKKEYVAELMATLVCKEREAKHYKKALDYAELALKLNPLSITHLVQKSALCAWLACDLNEEQAKKPLSPGDQRSLEEYVAASKASFERARSLGYVQETPLQREKYMQSVKAEQHDRNNP